VTEARLEPAGPNVLLKLFTTNMPETALGDERPFMTRMFTRALALFLSLATMLFVSLGVASAAQAKPPSAGSITTTPVTGTLADGTGAVTGTFNAQQFVVQNGVLQAVGTFTGTVTNAAGATTTGSQQISLPVDVAQAQASCQILDLVLGPLDLNLLGLQVHLDQLHLNITAQPGPGNLLGNLLCAVAGLLNGTTTNALLQQIANLLNQILGLLG
jgi:hypothetical protein